MPLTVTEGLRKQTRHWLTNYQKWSEIINFGMKSWGLPCSLIGSALKKEQKHLLSNYCMVEIHMLKSTKLH